METHFTSHSPLFVKPCSSAAPKELGFWWGAERVTYKLHRLSLSYNDTIERTTGAKIHNRGDHQNFQKIHKY